MAWGLAQITSAEITEWKAFARLEPAGGRHEDQRWGYLLALFANAHKGKNADAVKPADWFLSLQEPDGPQGDSVAKMQMTAAAAAAVLNAHGSRVKPLPKKKPPKPPAAAQRKVQRGRHR